MWNEPQIQFELKLHSLQNTIVTKQQQLGIIQTKIHSLASAKIQSQDQIIELITQVHVTIKKVEGIVGEIREPCAELKLGCFYELFRNVCAVLMGCIKLLAEGCENGVERNLLKFISSRNSQQQCQTICLQKQHNQHLRSQQLRRALKIQESCQFRTQLQIDRMYQTILSQRESVLKTTSSNAVMKLNEVKMSWMKMINDSDQMLEEAHYRKGEGGRELIDKIQKPEYIARVLREELAVTMKAYFRDYIEKSMTKMHQQFYAKIKQEIQNHKPKMQSQWTQTEVDGLNKSRIWTKQKKNVDKLTRELQDAIRERKEMAEQYLKMARSNDIYASKIEDLERKIARLNSIIKMNDKKPPLQSYRASIRNSRRGSSFDREKLKQLFGEQPTQIEKVNLLNGGIFKSDGQQILQRYKNMENSANIMEIVKKKNKFRKVYTKSRMHTENVNSRMDKETEVENESVAEAQPEEKKVPERQTGQQLKSQKIKSQRSMKILEQSMKLIKDQECKNAIVSIIELVQKLKSSDPSSSNEARKSIQNQNKESLENGCPQNPTNSGQQSARNAKSEQMAERVMCNPDICSIFDNLIKKVFNGTKAKMEQIKNEEEKKVEVNKGRIRRQSSIKNLVNKTNNSKKDKQAANEKDNDLADDILMRLLLSDKSENNNDSSKDQKQFEQKTGENQVVYQNLDQKQEISDQLKEKKQNKMQNYLQMGKKARPMLKDFLPNTFWSNTLKSDPKFNNQRISRFQKLNINKPATCLLNQPTNLPLFSSTLNSTHNKHLLKQQNKRTHNQNHNQIHNQIHNYTHNHNHNQNHNQNLNQTACTSKLISIQQVRPHYQPNNQDIARDIVNICQRFRGNGDGLEEQIGRYVGVVLRKLGMDRRGTFRDYRDSKFRIERLDTL